MTKNIRNAVERTKILSLDSSFTFENRKKLHIPLNTSQVYVEKKLALKF